MTKKDLNSLKINLVNKVKLNEKLFYNKASMNSFIDKIVKSNRFNKIDDYTLMLDYIIKNKITYTSKQFDTIVSDVSLLVNLSEQKTEDKQLLTVGDVRDMDHHQIINRLSRKIINIHDKNPNHLIKVKVFYPGTKQVKYIESDKFKKFNMYSIKNLVFWLLHDASDEFVPKIYYDMKGRIFRAPGDEIQIYIYTYPKIKGFKLSEHYRIIQSFKDSKAELLCVPTAIKNYFINKRNETTNKGSIYTINTKINKITQPKYNKPYNLDELKELSVDIGASFTITDFVNQPIYIGKSNHYNITLINTRMNHLENYCNDEVKIDSNKVDDILRQLPNYVKDGSKIYTKDKTYIVNKSEFSKSYREHIEQFNLERNYLMADSSESEYISNYYMTMHQFFNNDLFQEYKTEISKVINDFVENRAESVKITSDLDFGLDVETYKSEDNNQDKLRELIQKRENEMFREIDLIKAYYTLTNKSEYGVPSNAFIYYNDKYAEDINDHLTNKMVGYYTVTINESSKKFDTLFGSNKSNIVLTTPQVMTLKNKNIDFKINSCIISPAINFKFNEKSLEKENDLKHFCKIAGTMMKESFHNKKYIKTDNPEEFIKLIYNKNENVEISIDNSGIIEIDDNANKTLKHIGFFIHSFVSAEVMNFILDNNESDILGVKLDSIIVKKQSTMTYTESLYKTKEANIYNLVKLDDGFLGPYIDASKDYINNCKPSIFGNDEQMYKRIVSLEGKGGSGKSTDIKNNFDAKKIVYGALAWSRGVDFKTNEYKCQITSLDRLIGYKCEKLKINQYCQMIVLDESTMINSTTIRQIINEFPDKRIVIIGDIDSDGFAYQCSLSDSLVSGFKLFNPKKFNCQSIAYTKNFRFDSELNNKLDSLRHFMKTNKDQPNKEQLLSDYVKNEFSSCFVDKSQINFNDGDMGISSLNEAKFDFAYSQYFINKGAKPVYYNNQTKFNQNIIKSNFSYNKPNHNSYEVRLFESVHACQGKTVPINSSLLIIIENNFDYQLYYTALSRARSLSQIKIINGF